MRITPSEIHICAYHGVDPNHDDDFKYIRRQLGDTSALVDAGPDAGTIYRLRPHAGCEKPSGRLAAELGKLDSVLAAWLRPELQLTARPAATVLDGEEPASLEATPDHTPDFYGSERQLYLRPAEEGGIGAEFAWKHRGGYGRGIRVVDVEREWRWQHEDIGRKENGFLLGGRPSGDIDDRNHGTSVLGILAAGRNAFGTRGLCPDADVRAVSIEGDGRTVAGSILEAAAHLRPGTSCCWR